MLISAKSFLNKREISRWSIVIYHISQRRGPASVDEIGLSFAGLAQLGEPLICNQQVICSRRISSTICFLSSMAEHAAVNRRVIGSSPIESANMAFRGRPRWDLALMVYYESGSTPLNNADHALRKIHRPYSGREKRFTHLAHNQKTVGSAPISATKER